MSVSVDRHTASSDSRGPQSGFHQDPKTYQVTLISSFFPASAVFTTAAKIGNHSFSMEASDKKRYTIDFCKKKIVSPSSGQLSVAIGDQETGKGLSVPKSSTLSTSLLLFLNAFILDSLEIEFLIKHALFTVKRC